MYRICAVLIYLAYVSAPAEAEAAQRGRQDDVTIGVVTDGPYSRYQGYVDLVQREILDLLAGEFDVRFPAEKFLEADWTLAGIEAAVDRLLADPQLDLILALGPISSHVVARRRDLSVPAIAPFIIDPELQGLPRSGGGSGVTNLSYVALPRVRDIQAFRELVPFTRIAVLMTAALHQSIPDISEDFRVQTRALGLDPLIVPVGASVDSALAALDASDVEAVYVFPLQQISAADFERLSQGLITRRLPSFAWFGVPEVEAGILAGQRAERFMQRLARRIALNVQRILLGEDPSGFDVFFAPQDRLTINMATARAIGVYPRFAIMTEADLIGEVGRRAERRLSLEGAVREAVAANLDLAAQDRAVAAGAQSVKVARSTLLPQVDVAAFGSLIDEDRAASLLTEPQRSFAGSAQLTQIIYAEPLWANVSVERSVQEARLQNRETTRLDIALDAAVTYLNVLKAGTFERIQQDNLRVTRENLELAQVREQIGSAGPGEVYRWQNQIANNRQGVIDASAQRNLAEIELNRLLHRPLEESFDTEEAELADSLLMARRQRLIPYIDDLWSFRVFRRFMAREALAYSPEIRALDALISAQRRSLRSAESAFWQPTLAVEAGLTNIFATGGAGSDPFAAAPSGIPGLEEPDDLNWSIGFRVSYPLFSGGSRFAGRSQAAEDLARARLERDAFAERVEGRVRSALHQMGASLASIELSRDAAEAARNNFELVQDAYSRGVAAVIDLLDAQNAALVADEVAANAVFDFLIDLMRVERAAGRFEFFMTEEEREAFFQRLDAFVEAAGEPAPRR